MEDKSEWKAGMKCVIVDTAMVLARYPELVGTNGEIRSSMNASTPASRSIEVMVCDGRILKLHPSALQPVSSAQNSNRNALQADDIDSDDENDPTKLTQALKRGTAVRIARTDTVQQRCPHMIGRIGVVKEVPQHPNTWYKVQFSDRKVHVFRPSALRRVAERDTITNTVTSKEKTSSSTTLPQKVANKSTTKSDTAIASTTKGTGIPPLPTQQSGSSAKHISTKARTTKPASNKPSARLRPPDSTTAAASSKDTTNLASKTATAATTLSSARLLSTVDTERWVGMLVKVRGMGRWGGAIGRILSSGNGWVQLRTTRGEVAKRAYELEIVPDGEPIPKGLEWDIVNACILGEASLITDKASGATSSSKEDEDETDRKIELRTRSKPRDDAFSAPDGPTAAAGRRAGARRAEAEAAANSNNDSDAAIRTGSATSQQANRQQSGKSESKGKATSNIMSRGSKSTGSSSTTAKQSAYRDSVRKHLERQREKFKERPHLAEWLEALQGGPWDPNESAGGAYFGAYADDPDNEQQDTVPLLGPRWNRVAEQRAQDKASRLLPAGCAFCRVEIIPDSCGRVCWNELCIASPIFVGLFDDEVSSAERRAKIVAKMATNTLSIEPLQSRVLTMAAARKTKKSLGPGPALLNGQSLIYVSPDAEEDIKLEEPTRSPPALYNTLLERYEKEEAERLKAEREQRELEEARRRDSAAAEAAAQGARLQIQPVIKEDLPTITTTITSTTNPKKESIGAMQIVEDHKPEPQVVEQIAAAGTVHPFSDQVEVPKSEDKIGEDVAVILNKKRIREENETIENQEALAPEAKQPRLETEHQRDQALDKSTAEHYNDTYAKMQEDEEIEGPSMLPSANEATSSGGGNEVDEENEKKNGDTDEGRFAHFGLSLPPEAKLPPATKDDSVPSVEDSSSDSPRAKAPRLGPGPFALPPSEDELRRQLGDAPYGRDHKVNWPPPKPACRLIPQPIATTFGTRFPPPSAAEMSSNGDSTSPVPASFTAKPWFDQNDSERNSGDRSLSAPPPPSQSTSLQPPAPDVTNNDEEGEKELRDDEL